MTRLRSLLVLSAAALATLWLSTAVSAQADGSVDEAYYVMKLGGQRAGWMRESTTRADGTITSAAEVVFKIGRGATSVSLRIETEFVETTGGEPVSMRSLQQMGTAPIETSYAFDGETVRITTRQSGRETTAEQPAPAGDWVTPARADHMLREALASGAPIPSITSLDPTYGLTPLTSNRTNAEPAVVEVFGKTVPATRVETELSIAPGMPSVEYLDADGRLVRSTTRIGGMEIVVLAADRDLALAEIEAPEIMRSTFVQPSRKIADPRSLRRASYTLSVPDGRIEDLYNSPQHQIERLDERRLRLTVDLDAPPARSPEPGPSHLEASAMIDRDDEAVRAMLGRSALRDGASQAARAEGLRRFVHRSISQKSLDVGFASASEVARSGVGDCTEHAVLLAALLRADGIPSRVVSGLVYAQDFAGAQEIFGYHMWTQAWIDGPDGPGWIDLDATMPNAAPTDATHIAISATDMSGNDSFNAMLTLAPLLGRLEIEVVETGLAGGH
ncbi:MAG: transglutaminase-like domain-containing protein [Planctomycetota bacterium]